MVNIGRRSSTVVGGSTEKVTLRPAGDERLEGVPARRSAGTGVASGLSVWMEAAVLSWLRRGDLCRTVTRT